MQNEFEATQIKKAKSRLIKNLEQAKEEIAKDKEIRIQGMTWWQKIKNKFLSNFWI